MIDQPLLQVSQLAFAEIPNSLRSNKRDFGRSISL
jgi:hypothetical protein